MMRGPIESGMRTKPSNPVGGQPVKATILQAMLQKGHTPSEQNYPFSWLTGESPLVMCIRPSRIPQPRVKCNLPQSPVVNTTSDTISRNSTGSRPGNDLAGGMQHGTISESKASIGA